MQYQFPEFIFVFVITAALCFLSAVMTWRRRINPGSIPFALLMLSLFVWSFASIFEAGAMAAEGKIFWSKLQYIGIINVSPLWVYFTVEFTGRDKFLKTKWGWLLWVIPVITLFLAFTNFELHNWVWTGVEVSGEASHIADYSHGAAFYIHTAFSYACLLTGTIWLLQDFIKQRKIERFKSALFIFGVLVSWAANILYILELIPIPGFDITPISFSLSALILSWNIYSYRLFDLVPIARDTLFDNMEDGVIVIDPNDFLLAINAAAIEIAGYEGSSPIGRSVWEVFDHHLDVIAPYRGKSDFHEELLISEDPLRVVDMQVSSIKKDGKDASGQLIVLRDITIQKEVERIEKEQRDFAEALADTAAVINSSLEINDVLQEILENVGKVVPHESSNIALVTEQGKAEFVRVKNPEKYNSMEFLLALKLNLFDIKDFKTMAETQEPIIIADTHKDENWTPNSEHSAWIRSYLGAPIIHQGELLGFINLDAGVPNFFKPEHAEHLKIFTNYAASAITNAKLYSDTRYYAEETAILYEISLAIAAGVGLEKTTQAVFRQLKKVVPTDLFFLALYEKQEKMISYFMYQADAKRIDIEPFYLVQRPSLTRYVIQKSETVYIPDFKAEDSEVKEEDVIRVPGFDNRSFLGIPLILRSEVIGVLSVQSADPNAYNARQIRLVETIAQQATIAMDNAKLFEKMQEMAITDGLTGLYNRRYFYMILNNEIERVKRYSSQLSLVMIDIDHFKKVNDKLGHLAGDEVLQSIAEVCKQLLRQSDNMFRYGGEEFMIVLPETAQEEALKVAERIRETVADMTFETKKGGVKITISLGVSQYDADEFSDPNIFIESADQTLYAAKQAGRNCVRVFSK